MLKRLGWTLALLSLFGWSWWSHLSPKPLAAWLQQMANQQLRGQAQIRLEEAHTGLFHLDLKGLKVQSPQGQTWVLAEETRVKFYPWTLVWSRGPGFAAKLYEGQIQGSLSLFPRLGVDLSFAGIEPNRQHDLRALGVILSNPVVSGQVSWRLSGEPQGQVELKLAGLNLGGEAAQRWTLVQLPDTNWEELALELALEGGQAQIKLQTQGAISGWLEGQVTPQWANWKQSQASLRFKGKMQEELRQALGPLASFLQNYTNRQGEIALGLKGSLFQLAPGPYP